jgi:hypothetical protein
MRRSRRKSRLALGVGAIGNDGANALLARCLTVSSRIVTLIGHCGARHNIGAGIEQRFEAAIIVGLAACQTKADGKGFYLFSNVSSSRSRGLSAWGLAPLLPADDRCARTIVESNIRAK